MASAPDDVIISIRKSTTSKPWATMNIPVAHLYHYARRPEEWLRAVCIWSVGGNGAFESSMDDETYAPVVFPSQGNPISRFYRFTALEEDLHLMNLADTRQRGTESVTPSSRASAESGANNIIMDRDGTLCVFALSSPAEKAHLIPHRVQSKGRWAALAAKRFPGVDDINAPENIITLDRGLHSLVDQHKYAFLPLDEHLTEDDVHPQGSNGPPAKANRTKCKTILLHEVLALPPPKPRSSRDQLAHDEQLESHRTRFPHNLRPQFMTLDRLPSLAILGYRYALVIVDHYGTAGTKKLLDQDYTVDPDPDHSPDLDDGDHEAHTPTDGGSPGKGFHLRLPSNFQQGGRKSSRNATNAPKDEGAVADMWDVALDREDNLRVAPCQADVDALLAKRDEEKLQSVREWVLTQRLSY